MSVTPSVSCIKGLKKATPNTATALVLVFVVSTAVFGGLFVWGAINQGMPWGDELEIELRVAADFDLNFVDGATYLEDKTGYVMAIMSLTMKVSDNVYDQVNTDYDGNEFDTMDEMFDFYSDEEALDLTGYFGMDYLNFWSDLRVTLNGSESIDDYALNGKSVVIGFGQDLTVIPGGFELSIYANDTWDETAYGGFEFPSEIDTSDEAMLYMFTEAIHWTDADGRVVIEFMGATYDYDTSSFASIDVLVNGEAFVLDPDSIYI